MIKDDNVKIMICDNTVDFNSSFKIKKDVFEN